jgi:hypothetical protein
VGVEPMAAPTTKPPYPTRWSYANVPLQIVGTLLFGGGIGIGQHFFYAYLDGKPVENQAVSPGMLIARIHATIF